MLLRLYLGFTIFVLYTTMWSLFVDSGNWCHLSNFRTDHSEPFKSLNLEHVEDTTLYSWKHHGCIPKAREINVINNYGLPRLTSHYLSFPDVLRLPPPASLSHRFSVESAQWQLGWDRQESTTTLVFKYIFGLGFKTGGWKNFKQTSGLENPFVRPDTVLPADILTWKKE